MSMTLKKSGIRDHQIEQGSSQAQKHTNTRAHLLIFYYTALFIFHNFYSTKFIILILVFIILFLLFCSIENDIIDERTTLSMKEWHYR